MKSQLWTPSRHAVAASAFALALLALAASPLAANAAHIASRFTAPAPPDPSSQNQYPPQVSGIRIAWKVMGFLDDPVGFQTGFVWTIGTETAAERTDLAQAEGFDYAAWQTPSPRDILVYCLPQEGPDEVWLGDGTTSVKLSGDGNDARNPRIAGTNVVWQERVAGSWDIHAAQIDPVTLSVTRSWVVCSAPGDQIGPDVDGGYVVWQDRRGGQWDVYIRESSTGSEKRLTTSRAKQLAPRIQGRWVVWTDYRNAGYGADIYGRRVSLANLESDMQWRLGKLRVVCHARKDQLEPDVGDGFAVWADWRNGWAEVPPDVDIRGYDLVSRDRFRITGGGMQVSPDLDGGTLAYSDFQTMLTEGVRDGRVKGAVLQH